MTASYTGWRGPGTATGSVEVVDNIDGAAEGSVNGTYRAFEGRTDIIRHSPVVVEQ
jgi:hypothetical protein